MRCVFLNLAALFLLVTGIAGAAGQEAAISTADLVQGILARAENPFSGQMTYRLKSGFRVPGHREAPEEELALVFSGPSWRLRSRVKASEMPVVRQEGDLQVESTGPPLPGFVEVDKVSHHGKSVELQRTPQDDGSVRNVAYINHQKPIVPESPPYPPFFAGTFWYENTRKFVAAHKDKASRKSAVEVNGVRSEVIEWAVPAAEKYAAFHSVGELTRQGGTLRVYAAPDKGFALPRVEHIGANGQVEAAFDSWDFREYAEGIFIPQRCEEQLYSSKGPGFYLEYQFDNIKGINLAVPDSEFIIPLPPGTRVSDGRGEGGSISFDVKKDGPIPQDLEDVIGVATPHFWGRNWLTAFIVGLIVGLVVLGLALLGRRLFRRRGAV